MRINLLNRFMFTFQKASLPANATKFWITKTGKCLLAHNNSDYDSRTLNYLSKAIEANKDIVIEKWLSFFGEISFYC